MSHDFTSRCPGCSGEFCVTQSSGPVPCPIMFVGERPGREENKGGIPFIGQAGKEYNEHYLPLAGLDRPDVHLANSVRCWALGNRKPSDREFTACTEYHLKPEIEMVRPELLVLMGGTAAKLVPELDLETHHGFPVKAEVFGVERWVFLTYHPALGLHDTRRIRALREDFTNLWKVLRAKDPATCVPVDEHLGREEYSKSREAYVNAEWLYLDTETFSGDDDAGGARSKMWSGQLSKFPGSGRLYRANDLAAMRAFQKSISTCKTLVIHNAPFDLDVLYSNGIAFDESKVLDTMQMAYHVGISQGLKPLAFRLAGMKMQTFSDLVMPASKELVMEWLTRALDKTESQFVERYGKRGQLIKPEEVKHPLRAEVTRMLRSVLGNEGYNPWKRWKEVKAGDTAGGGEKGEMAARFAEVLEEELGPVPRAGIDKVEEAKAVWYGARDTDALARVFPVLDRMERKVGAEVVRRDYDL